MALTNLVTIPGGLYITFEGVDRSGKDTQLALLAKRLEAEHYDVATTFEPTNIVTVELPDGSKKSWRQLLKDKNFPLTPQQQAMGFWYNDRWPHHTLYVRPWMKQGKIVFGNRDADSSYTYQCFAGGVSREAMDRMREDVMGSWRPDMTLLYAGPIEELLKRAKEGEEKDRFDSAGIAFQKKVQEGYLVLAAEEPDRIKVLDALKSIEELHEETYTLVKTLIDSRK